MPGGRRYWLIVLGLAAGCRSPAVLPPCPAPSTAQPPALTVVPAASLEGVAVPMIDPAKAALPAPPAEWRGLTEDQCRCLAAVNSSLARLIEQEGQRSDVVLVSHRQPCPPDQSWKCELRRHAADEARNRAAADALDRYFQLADAVARVELLDDGLALLDRVRADAPTWRAAGLPTPTDDELLRRRAKLLADAEQAEAGIRLLDVDLKMRLGLSTKTADRLRPVGPFAVTDEPLDVEALVQAALERRADLRFLRTLHQNLSADSLPLARDTLRAANPLLGDSGPSLPQAGLFGGRVLEQAAEMATGSELPVRQQQLFDLIAERERQAAAEVRAAASQLAPLARRAALAHARAESWRATMRASTKPAERQPAELEWYAARAEAVSAAFDWQRARAKLRAAGGGLPDGCE